MSKFLSIVFVIFFSALNTNLFAQSNQEISEDPMYFGFNKNEKNDAKFVADTLSNAKRDHVIFVEVPKKLNIKDKIFLVNHTQTSILQAVVVLMTGNSYKTVGNASLVTPGSRFEMASYDDNWLKKLKGKTIGIKIKGAKKAIADISSTGVVGGGFAIGGFGVGVQHQEVKAEDLNNISPELITYDYSVQLSEEDHDLYITVTNGGNAFDF